MPKNIKTISKREFYKMISEHYSVPIVKNTIIPFTNNIRRIILDERKILYRTAKSIKPKVILEIGTSYGHTASGLFVNALYADVYTIDIYRGMKIGVPIFQKTEVFPRKEIGKVFKNKIPGIYQIFGDSRQSATYQALKGKTVDFAFIDGNHSLSAVIKDTINVLKFTKNNSIIFWHDFKNDKTVEVKAALDSLLHTKRLKIFHIDKTWLAFTIL